MSSTVLTMRDLVPVGAGAEPGRTIGGPGGSTKGPSPIGLTPPGARWVGVVTATAPRRGSGRRRGRRGRGRVRSVAAGRCWPVGHDRRGPHRVDLARVGRLTPARHRTTPPRRRRSRRHVDPRSRRERGEPRRHRSRSFKASGTRTAAGSSLLAVAVGTVALSWSVVHTVFTLRSRTGVLTPPVGGIDLKSDEHPDYGDFAYSRSPSA